MQLDSGEAFKLKPANVRAEGLAAIAPLLDQRVETYGMNRAELDGLRGVAIDYHTSKEDYGFKLDSGERLRVPAANVRAEGAGGGATAGKAKGKGKKG